MDEETLRSIKLLKQIKKVLDTLMHASGTKTVIRLNELTEYLLRDPMIREAMPTPKAISQFLRDQHQQGILKQLIPNCHVDTSNHTMYQWYFNREVLPAKHAGSGETLQSTNRYMDRRKHVSTASGVFVRSLQERYILDHLHGIAHLSTRYEFQLAGHGGNKSVDFQVINNRTKRHFYWEHFGYTGSEAYKDAMSEKLVWYRASGFISVDDNGPVVFTYYAHQDQFEKDVAKYLELISS